MYIIKNAWRNICRNMGKNILLGIIALVIGLSCCLSLSIHQAAAKQRAAGLDELTINATIGIDRMSVMKQGNKENPEDVDPKEMLSNIHSLSLEELQTYAKAESVKDFYHTETLSMNAEGIEPLSSSDEHMPDMGKNFGGKEMSSADFSLIGYSTQEAMTTFVEGNASITKGTMFLESDQDTCIISEELAEYNTLAVGDTIKLVNPDNTKDVTELKISGIYSLNETSSDIGFMRSDPANQIYTSTTTIDTIVEASNKTDSDKALKASVSGTYLFENVDAYEAFEAQARNLGLSDDYTIQSQNLNQYEQSLQPLESLSGYATIFLVVVLVIAGLILVVLHIYHIRERKYEIGVLAAIGMNKRKIACQFVLEIFVVTMVSMLIGSGIGACISVPVTNMLLENTTITQNDRPGNFGKDMPEDTGDHKEMSKDMMAQGKQYIREVSSATDIIVVLEVCGIAVLLTMVSGGVAIMSILRYEPLKILSDRE